MTEVDTFSVFRELLRPPSGNEGGGGYFCMASGTLRKYVEIKNADNPNHSTTVGKPADVDWDFLEVHGYLHVGL